MTHVECKIAFIELVNEVWYVGSALNKKQRELVHSSAIYAILNPHVSLLASYLHPFQSISNVHIRLAKWTQCVNLNQVILHYFGTEFFMHFKKACSYVPI